MKHPGHQNRPKTIWIIDHYSSEPEYGGISRQYDFAGELGKRGCHIVVIASGFSHFTHSYITDKNIKVSRPAPNVHYFYLKTSGYTSNGGMERAKNMLDFMGRVILYEGAIAKRYGKPDVVTGCSVHPMTWIAAYLAARKYKARFVAEVRDFWPRVWVASGDKKRTDPMVVFFAMIQWWTFRHADRIIYSMFHGDKYICGELGVPKSKAYLIGQPMDCKRFDRNCENTDMLPQKIRTFMEIGKRKEKKSLICSFAGYYMEYEGVYVMLKAQEILEKKGLPVKMVFVGSGQEKEGMEQFAQSHALKNVLICDRIPKEAVPALLSHSDICMAHLEVRGHKEVYQYGVSKNKVNEYLYSGACTLYGFLYQDDEVAQSGGGMMFEPYQARDLAAKIEYLYTLPEQERRAYGQKGRKYIRETHSVEVLAERMTEVLFG